MPLELADCLALADEALLRTLVPAAGQQFYSRAGEVGRGRARFVTLTQQVADDVRPVLGQRNPALSEADLAERLAAALLASHKCPAPVVPSLAVLLARHGLPALPNDSDLHQG